MKFYFSAYFSSIIVFHEVIINFGVLFDSDVMPWLVPVPAVAKYDGVEEFFKEKHQNRLKSYKDTKKPEEVKSEGVKQLDLWLEQLKVKQEICVSIFSSDLFIENGEKLVHPNSVKSDLKYQNELYSEIFKRSNEKALLGGYKDKYENPFRLLSVTVKKDTEEAYVFSCLVKTAAVRDKYKMYYVSEEYDVSAASSASPTARPIIGRFVFARNEEKKLVVYALAQEPARSLVDGPRPYIEYFYLDKVLSHTASDDWKSDPVCKLKDGERLRLVNAIFSMEHLKNKYKSPTKTQNVEGECVKRTISFEGNGPRRKVGRKVFQEWTFICRISYSDGSKQDTFHISRGYAHDKVFLHRENAQGNIVLEWSLHHTGVVDDGQKGDASKKDEEKGKKKKEEETKKEKEESKTSFNEYSHYYHPDEMKIYYPDRGPVGYRNTSNPGDNHFYPNNEAENKWLSSLFSPSGTH